MSVAPADYLAAIEHLPAGAVLLFDDVPWDEYENLLADLGEGYAVRIFYDNGRMEVMAPASTHEKPKSVLHTLVTALARGLKEGERKVPKAFREWVREHHHPPQ